MLHATFLLNTPPDDHLVAEGVCPLGLVIFFRGYDSKKQVAQWRRHVASGVTLVLMLICAMPIKGDETRVDHDERKVQAEALLQDAWSLRANDYSAAIKASKEGLRLARLIADTSILLKGLNYVGVVYRNIGNYPKAVEHFFEAKKIAQLIGDKREEAYALNNLGDIYRVEGNLEEALSYSTQALLFFTEIGDKKGEAYALLRLGEAHQARKHYPLALEALQRALALREQERENPAAIRTALSLIGECHNEMGNYETALQFHAKVLGIAESEKNRQAIVLAINNIAATHMKLGRWADALRFGLKADSLATQLASKEQQRRAAITLAEIYAYYKQFDLALNYQKRAAAHRDALMGEEAKDRIAAIQASYDVETKQAQIELLTFQREKQEVLQRGGILLLSLFGVILILIVVAYRNKRAAAQLLELKNLSLERANQTSDALLLNILPKKIAERLKSGESIIADYFDETTILFADIVGFTKLSANTTPEALVIFLNDIFSRFDRLAEKYGLEKIKTIGDSYMIAGGIPEKIPDHAKRIALMALDMKHEIEEFDLAGSERLAIRIGIHSGPVVAGVIGDKKFIYDLWGDTVNTASRMESHGEIGKIHISHATYETLKDEFVCEPRGKIEIKGKGRLNTYFLYQAKSSEVKNDSVFL